MVIIHKSLEVYRVILEFIKLAAEIIKHVPRGQGHLSDQLRRASTSMAFNTAEGAGEFAKKEKARFYRMALRSSTESASIIDVIYGFGFIGVDLYDAAERLLDRIIGMLTKLVQRHGGMLALSESARARHESREADLSVKNMSHERDRPR
jgi:four helix bundle protein